MGNKKTEGYVRKRKVVPKTKSLILKDLCNDEQYKIIRQEIERGSTFILLGSEHALKDAFYKGLHQEMYAPVYNGACIYDSYRKYRKAFDRDIITVSLNDPGNESTVDSIKRLGVRRSKTLYSFKYTVERGGSL